MNDNGWPGNPKATWSKVGNTLVTWKPAAYDDKIAHAAREQLLLDLGEVKPHRNRKPRVDPGALERNGAAALRDKHKSPKRPWTVRIYYRSMSDGKCYAEFGGLTESEAWALRSKFEAKANEVLNKYHDTDAQAWGDHYRTIPPAKPGWRKVIFPSENTVAFQLQPTADVA